MRQGFSLVELLFVLFLIGLLIAVLFPSYGRVQARAREGVAQTHGGVVIQALSGYLALYITETPQSLLSRLALPSADWNGAPPSLSQRDPADRSCRPAYTLRTPTGGPTGFSWEAAPPRIGCAFGVRNIGGVSRFVVYTWVEGGTRWYENGR